MYYIKHPISTCNITEVTRSVIIKYTNILDQYSNYRQHKIYMNISMQKLEVHDKRKRTEVR